MQHGVLASSVIIVQVAMLVYPRYQSGITIFGDVDDVPKGSVICCGVNRPHDSPIGVFSPLETLN